MGLAVTGLNKYKVMKACDKSQSHCDIKKEDCKEFQSVLKWFWNVCMAFQAKLALWFWGGANWKFAVCLFVTCWKSLDVSLSNIHVSDVLDDNPGWLFSFYQPSFIKTVFL